MIKKKIYDAMGMSENSWTEENMSFYRVFKFITSVRGQKKIWNLFWKIIKYIIRKTTSINLSITPGYKQWKKINFPTKTQLDIFRIKEKEFNYRPKISIILPVYNPPEDYFKAALQSVIDQVYSNWELCIADDLSTNENIKNIILHYAEKEERIKYIFRKENGHISAASNSAIDISTGAYISFLDHDDLLAPNALYENVLVLNNDREIDFIYSDEDKVDEREKFINPYFKPGWCPDNFLVRNYICHFTLINSSLVKEVGGFRIGYEGSQDYDLFLRVTEKVKKIHHISKILYHWRMHKESTSLKMDAKPYAYDAGIKSVQDALKRRGVKGDVSLVHEPGCSGFYQIRYQIEDQKKVSVIIPSKDQAKLTDECLSSIFKLTTYSDYEVILIDNNSAEDSFFEMVDKWKEKEPNRFKCISDNGEFNFSRLMNKSAEQSSGEYLLLLNNDTEIIHADWMTALVEQAQRKSIGAVGVKLIYKNDTVQHAGVVIGLGGIAGHTFIGSDKDALVYYDYLKTINNYSAVTAACLMVRKETYEEVGGFNEELAIEFNDVDFCLKLKEKGYNNIYLPHVTLYHYESVSRGHPHKTKESYERHVREMNIFTEKWQKYMDDDPCYNKHLSLIYTDFRIKVK